MLIKNIDIITNVANYIHHHDKYVYSELSIVIFWLAKHILKKNKE